MQDPHEPTGDQCKAEQTLQRLREIMEAEGALQRLREIMLELNLLTVNEEKTFQNLSDDHVVSRNHAAQVLGTSKSTIKRIPDNELPIVQISARRIGYRMGDIRRYIETRTRGGGASNPGENT